MIVLFIIMAVLLQICLACIDGFFNRMIRNHIEDWEKFSEFEWITWFLLVGCTFLPALMIWTISEFHALIYGISFCIVQWDLIFGRIVYGGWTNDTPSIKFRGKWRSMRLRYAIMLRGLVGLLFVVYLVVKYF